MTQFYLLRHAEPEWSLLESPIDDCYRLKGHGRDLVPLTDNGIAQAKAAARDPRIGRSEIILSSPYTRALHTAAIVSKESGIDIKVELDLREWQPDLSFEFDSLKRLEDLYHDYQQNHGVYPTGKTRLWESRESLRRRMDRVLERYLDYQFVTVVAHGEIFRSLTGKDEIPHGSIIEYRMERAALLKGSV